MVFNINAKIRIAIIDGGVNMNYTKGVKFCKQPFMDYTGTDITDQAGHGTNILANITKDLENVDYCVIIIKAFDGLKSKNGLENSIKGSKYALTRNVSIVNMSFGGLSDDSTKERHAVKALLDAGIKIFAAAGNEHVELNFKKCNYYPACYDNRIVTVGSSTGKYSNYGSYVKVWQDGSHISGGPVVMSGTSQATAIQTNFYIKSLTTKNK